jgi:DNA-binding HxlR family transcriptional regulator
MEIDTMDPASMQEPKAVRRELRTALTTITGKWKLEILWLLNQRVPHFGELQRGIPEVTQHVLTAQLRELEADRQVSRTVFAEVPPRVEYAITDRVRALKPVFEANFVWSRERPAQISRR